MVGKVLRWVRDNRCDKGHVKAPWSLINTTHGQPLASMARALVKVVVSSVCRALGEIGGELGRGGHGGNRVL